MKQLVKRSANAFGFEIRRLPTGSGPHLPSPAAQTSIPESSPPAPADVTHLGAGSDPFLDQARFLRQFGIERSAGSRPREPLVKYGTAGAHGSRHLARRRHRN